MIIKKSLFFILYLNNIYKNKIKYYKSDRFHIFAGLPCYTFLNLFKQLENYRVQDDLAWMIK